MNVSLTASISAGEEGDRGNGTSGDGGSSNRLAIGGAYCKPLFGSAGDGAVGTDASAL